MSTPAELDALSRSVSRENAAKQQELTALRAELSRLRAVAEAAPVPPRVIAVDLPTIPQEMNGI